MWFRVENLGFGSFRASAGIKARDNPRRSCIPEVHPSPCTQSYTLNPVMENNMETLGAIGAIGVSIGIIEVISP